MNFFVISTSVYVSNPNKRERLVVIGAKFGEIHQVENDKDSRLILTIKRGQHCGEIASQDIQRKRQ